MTERQAEIMVAFDAMRAGDTRMADALSVDWQRLRESAGGYLTSWGGIDIVRLSRYDMGMRYALQLRAWDINRYKWPALSYARRGGRFAHLGDWVTRNHEGR